MSGVSELFSVGLLISCWSCASCCCVVESVAPSDRIMRCSEWMAWSRPGVAEEGGWCDEAAVVLAGSLLSSA